MGKKAVTFRWTLAATLLGLTVWLANSCGSQKPPAPPAGGGPEQKTASDEPPIRVKGGSIDLQVFPVLTSSQWTKDETKPNKWDLLPSGRKVKNISVVVDGADDSKCPVVTAAVDSVTITLGINQNGTIQAAGSVTLSVEDDSKGNGKRHSSATGSSSLNFDSNTGKLSLPATGFIWKISSNVGFPKALDCTFASKGDLYSVYLFEW